MYFRYIRCQHCKKNFDSEYFQKCPHCFDENMKVKNMEIRCSNCGGPLIIENSVMLKEPSGDKFYWCDECKKKSNIRGEKLFDDARKIINGERQDQYGNPENSFPLIAERWTQRLQIRHGLNEELSAEDVAFMMVDFKLVREMIQRKRDNTVDAAGYLGIYDDLVEGKNEN